MKAKRSLGQNFLINSGIVEKIAEFGLVTDKDTVVEIGPGKGALTAELLARDARVVAVEKDDNLAAELINGYAGDSRIRIVHADILDQALPELIPAQAKVIANLPYNISTEVIARLAGLSGQIRMMVFMVQKEVGERICAALGSRDYSALTVLVGLNWTAEMGFVVGPGNFRPRPRVDSCVIRLVPRPQTIVPSDSFRRIVHQAFGQRRKMLRNSLMTLPGMERENLCRLADAADIRLDARPQELSAADFLRLSREFDNIFEQST